MMVPGKAKGEQKSEKNGMHIILSWYFRKHTFSDVNTDFVACKLLFHMVYDFCDTAYK